MPAKVELASPLAGCRPSPASFLIGRYDGGQLSSNGGLH